MPRNRRNWVPGAGAHLISRFVDRRFYLVDDLDRRLLVDALGRAQDRWDWRWLSWAAMSTHVHYGTVAGEVGPGRFFASAHTRFAVRFHARREGQTLGPVFADRPKLYPVPVACLLRMVVYHHRNPVAAGVVVRPSESRWTSHRVYLRLDPAPDWFDVEWALDVLGFADTAAGRRQFDELVMDTELDELPWGVGEPAVLERASTSACAGHVDLEALVALGREVTGLAVDEPIHSRRHLAALTRSVIARVAIFELGVSNVSVARAVRMSPGGLSNLLARRQGNADDRELVRQLIAQWSRTSTR